MKLYFDHDKIEIILYNFVIEKNSKLMITLRVRPNASIDSIDIQNDELIIKLRAIPQKGKANRSLLKFFSDFFGIKNKDIIIVAGMKSRNKIIQIPVEYKEKFLKIITQQSQMRQ